MMISALPSVNLGKLSPMFASCKERVEFLRAKGISFNALEHFLDGASSEPLCTDELHYATVIREPMARLRSLASYSEWNGTRLVRWATESLVPDEPFYHHVDNYYIRMLCGSDVFHLPRGAIGPSHLEQAKNVLYAFNTLIILEEWNEQYGTLLRDMQWRGGTHESLRNPSTAASKSKYFLTDAQAKILEHINRWDIRLYQMVVESQQASHNHVLQASSAFRSLIARTRS